MEYERVKAQDWLKQQKLEEERQSKLEEKKQQAKKEKERERKMSESISALPEEPAATDPNATTIVFRAPDGT